MESKNLGTDPLKIDKIVWKRWGRDPNQNLQTLSPKCGIGAGFETESLAENSNVQRRPADH